MNFRKAPSKAAQNMISGKILVTNFYLVPILDPTQLRTLLEQIRSVNVPELETLSLEPKTQKDHMKINQLSHIVSIWTPSS